MQQAHNHQVDEERMHPDYREREQQFQEAAGRLWDREQQFRERLRANASYTPEERQQAYMEGYGQITREFEQLVEGINQEHSRRIGEATRTLNAGSGDRFGDYLLEVSSKPAEELEGLLRTAQRTGQKDLARAVAAVALDKNRFGIFEEWSASDPETAEALRYVRTTPGSAQFHTRTSRALKPPKADVASLEPTQEDRRRAQEEAAQAAAPRQSFFNLPNTPRRQVGRKVS